MLATLEPMAPEVSWILWAAFLIAFLLAFSVGANDVSNSFGTSVGSRVLTVTQACILATFFEVAGATLLGYKVCDTFRRDTYKLELYENAQKELMLGALSTLIGSAAWNMVATALKMPISGTHSIVGATIGFSIVSRGWNSIEWLRILRIVLSWFVSPLVSGLISSGIYLLISRSITRKADPLKYGLKTLPLFYGATIFINVVSIVIDGPKNLGLDTLPWYAGLCLALVVAGVVICAIAIYFVPRLRRQILAELALRSSSTGQPKAGRKPAALTNTTSLSLTESGGKVGADNAAFTPDSATPPAKPRREVTLDPSSLLEDASAGRAGRRRSSGGLERPPIAPKPAHLLQRQQALDRQMVEIDLGSGKHAAGGAPNDGLGPGLLRGERYEVARLFSSLQILTACFASFAHGSNDVSNAVAPLVPIWNIYADGRESLAVPTQVWILLFGGIGICTGLWAWGRAVMSTIGDGLTKLTPSKGFAIELGAAISVLAASKLGLPISTTHCKVGSVVIVGLVSEKYCSSSSDPKDEAAGEQKGVDWKLFGNIAITWIVTVPLAAAASALVMVILRWFALP